MTRLTFDLYELIDRHPLPWRAVSQQMVDDDGKPDGVLWRVEDANAHSIQGAYLIGERLCRLLAAAPAMHRAISRHASGEARIVNDLYWKELLP